VDTASGGGHKIEQDIPWIQIPYKTEYTRCVIDLYVQCKALYSTVYVVDDTIEDIGLWPPKGNT
jgi:hypothetical protein